MGPKHGRSVGRTHGRGGGQGPLEAGPRFPAIADLQTQAAHLRPGLRPRRIHRDTCLESDQGVGHTHEEAASVWIATITCL